MRSDACILQTKAKVRQALREKLPKAVERVEGGRQFFAQGVDSQRYADGFPADVCREDHGNV
jgi:hypothetical protein